MAAATLSQFSTISNIHLERRQPPAIAACRQVRGVEIDDPRNMEVNSKQADWLTAEN